MRIEGMNTVDCLVKAMVEELGRPELISSGQVGTKNNIGP